MKAIGYIRVSTEDQCANGVSLDAQRAKIEAYCSLKDMDLLEIIEDRGISAKNLNRLGMQRVLDMVKSAKRPKQVESIVVLKLDRMFRSTIDALQTTCLFEKHGVSFHSIQETIDTSSAMGKFFFTLLSSIAELERNQVSERTKLALRHKRLKGEKTGGYVPYGYDLDFNTMKLIPNEDEQKAITMMKNYRAQGMTYQVICDLLHQLGIQTKQDKDWKPNTVRRTLKYLEKPFNTST